MKEVRRVVSLLLFVILLDNYEVSAQLSPVSSCTPVPAGVSPPNAVADLVGIWYIYATDSSSFVPRLYCGVCQIKSSGDPNMQCIVMERLLSFGRRVNRYTCYTGTLSYTSGTKIFKFTGTGASGSTSFDFEFVISTFNTATSSMVIKLCNGLPVIIGQQTYQTIQIGLALGGDVSTLTDISTNKVDVTYKTDCLKNSFDFTKTTGIVQAPPTDTTQRDETVFTNGLNCDAACVATAQCTAISNLVCTNSKCACKTGYCKANSACEKEVALGEDCKDSCQCSGANQECDSTTKKCVCKTNFCDNGSKQCVAKKTLGDACAVNCECTKGTNQECKNSKCACVTNYCDDGNKNCVKNGKNCDDACVTSCECTAISNLICNKEKKCACDTNYCKVAKVCEKKGNLGDACKDNCQCTLGTDQECVGGKCVCKANFCDNGSKKCVAKNKGNDDACEANCQCSAVTNQECKNSKCACKTGFCFGNSKCLANAAHDTACEDSCQCTGPNQQCSSTTKKCECKAGFCFAAGSCEVDTKKYGESCKANCQCKDPEQECSAAKTCACKSTFAYVVSEKKCLPEKSNGEECVGSEQCKEVPRKCETNKAGKKICFCPDNFVYTTSCVAIPPDYVKIKDGLYLRRVNEKKKFADAKSDCEDDVSGKSRLAVIKDEAINGEVAKLIKGKESAWFGLKQTSLIKYTREDGSTFSRPPPSTPTAYENWYKEHSYDQDKTLDTYTCIYMYEDDGKWEDSSCDCLREFVCEVCQ